MSVITVLAPEYFKDFSCIGSDCEYTCCAGWGISIDEDTYNKYRRIDEKVKKIKKGFSPLAGDTIVRVKKDKKISHLNNYAKFNLKENGDCPFLNEKKLCEIYINIGSNNMPYTCKSYPRTYNNIDNTFEVSLTLSCPEVARLALLNKDIMVFENVDFEDYKRIYAVNLMTKNNVEKEEHRYFWDIRIASIDILQNRNFYLLNRIVILNMLYKKIQKCIDEKNYKNISIEIAKFTKSIQSMSDNDFVSLSGNTDTQISWYRSILELFGDGFNKKFLGYIAMADSFLEKSENDTSVFLSAKKDYEKYTKNEKSYILENYLVNEYFRELMPFSNKYKENLSEPLIYLFMRYAFIQMLSLAHIEKYVKLTDKDLLKIIYLVSRNFSHSAEFADFILSFIKKSELDSIGGIYTLIF